MVVRLGMLMKTNFLLSGSLACSSFRIFSTGSNRSTSLTLGLFLGVVMDPNSFKDLLITIFFSLKSMSSHVKANCSPVRKPVKNATVKNAFNLKLCAFSMSVLTSSKLKGSIALASCAFLSVTEKYGLFCKKRSPSQNAKKLFRLAFRLWIVFFCNVLACLGGRLRSFLW